MCDKSIKEQIYILFDEGLSINEVVEKLDLYEYKSVVSGCYAYYNRMKNQEEKSIIEQERDKSDLDYEKLKICTKNFAESGRELMKVLSSLSKTDFSKKYDTYSFLRQIILHEIENEHINDEHNAFKTMKIVSQARRNYNRINEGITRFSKQDKNNLNSLVVLTENLVKLFAVTHDDGTEKFINKRINEKGDNVKKLVDVVRELI